MIAVGALGLGCWMTSDGKFGTFGGVFTPSLLTILGVIMYLRLPWVVGSVGLYSALGIIVVAHVISVSTGLSISSIATDKAVGAGGPYYIISRSLGLPIGGTLGLALFIGLSFSISLYIIGFSESFLTYLKLGTSIENIRICGTIVLVALTVVTFVSTALAIKTQYLILSLIALSLVSIFMGGGAGVETPHLQADSASVPLPAVFAIFFPAVTGFTAGVNMSGDLRSPKRSIPSGTMAAIFAGLAVYLGLAVFMAYRVPPEKLVGDPELLINVAWSGPLVVAGIWGATISSALGSILGSPRILQAVSSDAITPKFFARGFGPTQEPRNALALAFLIGEAGILIGELDAIARIVSMVFLTTYCVLNLSCALESWASPDFRPDFRIPKMISIVGAVTCLVVMIQLDLPAMAGAMTLMALLFLHLQRRQLRLESGDTWEGIWGTLVRTGLHRLTTAARQERLWKPNVLAFTAGEASSSTGTTHGELAEALAGTSGIVTHVHVSPRPAARSQTLAPSGPVAQAVAPARGAANGVFHRELACATDPDDTILDFCSHYGFAGIEPNTVLLRWSEYSARPGRLAGLLTELSHLDFNELVLAHGGKAGDEPRRRIDIWWRDQGGNIPLSLSLARFVTSSPAWEDAAIRFVLLSDNASNNDVLRARCRRYLKHMRVDADVKVISNTLHVKGYEDWVLDESRDADLVLLPLPDEPSEADTHFLTRAARILPELREVLFIRASSSFEEILSPGHSATQSLLPGPAGSDESFGLPELRLPRAGVLAEAAGALAGRYEEVLAGFDEHCIARLHSQNIELIRRLKRALERQFVPLEKALVDANARRRRQMLNRFQSSYVMDAHAIIDEHLREGLADQQATLEGRIDAFVDEDRLVGTDPRGRIVVDGERADFQPGSDDASHLRRFKRRRRMAAAIFRRAPRYAVPMTALKRHYFDRAKREILEPSVSQLVTESHQLAVHLGKILSGSRAGMTAIVGRTAEEEVTEEALAELKRSALAPFDELVERAKSRVRHHRREVLSRGHGLLQELCDDLDRIDVARLARKQRRVPRGAEALRTQLAELPKGFAETQRWLHERAKVGLTVSAFHHRLTAIVQRQKETATLQLRNGALRVCQDVRQALLDLSETLAAAPVATLAAPRVATNDEERLDPKEATAALSAEAAPALADLPESVQLLTDAAIDRLEEGHDSQGETMELSLRSLGQFLVESELVAGVHEQLDQAPDLEARAATVARDVTRLVAFQLAELKELGLADGEDRREHMGPAIESGVERLDAELSALRELAEKVAEGFDLRLAQVVEGSDPYRLTEAGSALGQHRRLRQGKIAVSGAQGVLRRGQAALREAMVSILYRGSAGVVLARSLARDGKGASRVERLRALVRDNSPRQSTLNALPFYYRQLFFGQAVNESFWVGRERELAQAKKAVQAHRDGENGIVLVVGEPGSGKTALCQRIATKALDQRPAFWVRPPPGGSADPAAFAAALRRAVGRPGSPDELIESLPEHAAVVIDDLELWWERSPEGFAVLDQILELVARHGGHQLFVVSVSRQAFRFLSRLRPIADRALAVVECGPMAARELGSILTLRHGSTGMKFELSSRQEDQLSSWQLARLFSRHFSYSGGSVGAALRSWITHIERVRDGVVTLRSPVKPSGDLLDELGGSGRALLLELLLHRRMTLGRLERVAKLPAPRLRGDVDTLVRSGLLVRGRHELLEINPFVHALVRTHFQQQGLLPA